MKEQISSMASSQMTSTKIFKKLNLTFSPILSLTVSELDVPSDSDVIYRRPTYDLVNRKQILLSHCHNFKLNVSGQVFKKPEKFDDEISSDDLTRRFEYDPWSVRSIAFTVTSSIVLVILSKKNLTFGAFSCFEHYRVILP